MASVNRKFTGLAILLMMFAPVPQRWARGQVVKIKPDPSAIAAQETAAALWKARSTVQQQLQREFSTLKEPLSQVTIEDERIAVYAVPDEHHFKVKEFPPGKYDLNLVDMMEAGTVTVKQDSGAYRLLMGRADPRRWRNFLALLIWSSPDEAKSFADAINSLGELAVLISLARDGLPVSTKLDVVTDVSDAQMARDQIAAWQRKLTPTPISLWKARRMVVDALRHVRHGSDFVLRESLSEILISDTAVEFFAQTDAAVRFQNEYPTGRYRIDLKNVGAFTTSGNHNGVSNFVDNFGDPCGKGIRDCAGAKPNQPIPPIFKIIGWDDERDARDFASGMNRLRAFARGEADKDADWSAFRQKAAAWRVLATKPPLPEEVRQQRILAENAIKEKQFDAAVEHYEEGLEIDPLWPQGQYNAALIYAELKYYTDAIQHMRCYVELVPEASDAQAARDQMVIWQDKLKQN